MIITQLLALDHVLSNSERMLIIALVVSDCSRAVSLVVWCGIKNGFGTRTTTIFVGTRKYAKIRVPAPKSDTGTHVEFGICVAKDSLFLLGPIMPS